MYNEIREDILDELSAELDGCDISIEDGNIEVYLDIPLESFYNSAISIANEVMYETEYEYTIDGDYEGRFTIEIHD